MIFLGSIFSKEAIPVQNRKNKRHLIQHIKMTKSSKFNLEKQF